MAPPTHPVHTGPCANRNPVYTEIIIHFGPEFITLETILINPLQTGIDFFQILFKTCSALRVKQGGGGQGDVATCFLSG